jgi:hypothetical protein
LKQQIKADEYRGKHVRFTARIKTRAVDGSAALWLRVDGPGMQGDNEWVENSLVLDVPDGAVTLLPFEGAKGPAPAERLLPTPTNLGFDL